MSTKSENLGASNWFEPLPKGCPPVDAASPNGKKYFRLVETCPPTETDFWSQRKLYPRKPFHTSECIAMALSLLSDVSACLNLLKLPPHRNKRIVEITPPPESGVLKRTGRDEYHHSWWRAKQFDPIPHCVEIVLSKGGVAD